MSMTSQGFPLWAVESDGTPHIVVGWDEHGYPHTVPASVPGLGLADFPDGTWFTFTTTDPAAQAFTTELVGDALDKFCDLRQRMAALADGLETSFPRSGAAGHAAARIREELAK